MSKNNFASLEELRSAIVSGAANRDDVIRLHEGQYEVRQEMPADAEGWQPIREFALQYAELRELYAPVRHYGDEGFGWGVGAGFVVFAIANAAIWHSVDRGLAVVWVALCGMAIALRFDGKIAVMIAVVTAMALQSDPGTLVAVPKILPTMMGMLAGTLLGGTIFGGPAGMIVGTGIGLLRRAELALAADFDPAEESFLRNRLVLPALWLAVLVPLYFMYGEALVEWIIDEQ